jgi:hypothetical protein
MLYSKNSNSYLPPELFKNPTSEYRGAPFWAWNCQLDRELLLKQIEQFKLMGMGGFHIHCRTGLATEYLGPEFMELVKACNEKAKKEGLLCWLYDEDRWPSGFGGGLVTKDEKYRARFLVFTPTDYEKDDLAPEEDKTRWRTRRSNKRKLLGRYEVLLKNGYLVYYRKLAEGEPAKRGKLWWAYLEVAGDYPWFNNQAYVNTLDKRAINRFIEITHQRYYTELGEDFGKTIPAIFTDEPQLVHKDLLDYPEEERDIILPFTDDFPLTYQETYGENILEQLPELIWELPDEEVSVARYRYHDHLSERFTEAFPDNIGNWCREHGIMLTGHLMHEPTLYSQTLATGEVMRSYRSFQLPGIDMLCDKREYTTAKQAQSVARQYGRPGVLSELYGVTYWDFDFRGHKLAGDWQAAVGVTVRVHHLSWVSMAGEAKRDYPASIGYQSPWYREYSLIEDHFSRLNTALTRGKARVRVGVIHPIESYWLYWGPREQTAHIREELEANFKNITEWLLTGLIDFDFISEALLTSLTDIKKSPAFKVGKMSYDVILIPGCKTLRSTTLQRLEAFVDGGGQLFFIGEPAGLVDARRSCRVRKLAERCQTIPFSKNRVLSVLEKYREIEVRKDDGTPVDNLFYQLRVDGEMRWLFITHVKKMENPDMASMEDITIKIKGSWIPVIYDTMTGEIKKCSAEFKGGQTVINYRFSQHDSLLLHLEPGQPRVYPVTRARKNVQKSFIEDPVPVSLSEPNVLLLDMAEYAIDNGDWQPREEILRIDNLLRESFGYPLRIDDMAQPWIDSREESFEHLISLRFIVNSGVRVEKPFLALEKQSETEIFFNGIRVESNSEGWFVDKAIQKIPLPPLPPGKSEIILKLPFNSRTNLEWCYLLGDFGVEVKGRHLKIIEPVRELAYGDWTSQGLPFYAGNVTYHCRFSWSRGRAIVEIPQFRSPLLKLILDGKPRGVIAFAPYRLDLGEITEGKHRLDITAYGNRVNTFGAIHNCDRNYRWFGPQAWRTEGNSWAYEYQLKPMGILIQPRLRVEWI